MPSRVNREKTASPACPEIEDVRDLKDLRDRGETQVNRVSMSWDLPVTTEGPEETEDLGYRVYVETPENQARKEPPVEACARSVPSGPWVFPESKENPVPPDVPEETERTGSLDPEETTAALVPQEYPESVETGERTAGQVRMARQDSQEAWAHQEPRERLVTREGPVFQDSPVFLDQTDLMV